MHVRIKHRLNAKDALLEFLVGRRGLNGEKFQQRGLLIDQRVEAPAALHDDVVSFFDAGRTTDHFEKIVERQGVDEPLHAVVKNQVEHLALTLDVPVDRALPHTCPGRDIGHAGLLVTVFGEGRECGVDDLLTPSVGKPGHRGPSSARGLLRH